MAHPRPVGIWIRVSTDDQVRGESPERHEARARAYAEAKGWTVVARYRLDAVSGRSVKAHPETKRMLADVASGQVAALIFSNLSRLARNTRELLEFADHFQDRGADLVSLAEAIDTTTPAGRMFFTVKAALVQWEREEIAARVAASVPIRAQQGKPLGGAAPFGFRWEDQELQLDETEAPIRRLMFELFVEHKRVRTVASLLNERGYRTRRGARWTHSSVRRLLRDPVAKGWRRANYTRIVDEKTKTWELKPESDWVWHRCPQIVSEGTWSACNAVLDRNLGKTRSTPKRAKQLFSGIVVCHCGAKMYVKSNNPKYVCNRTGCRNKISADDLEAVFHAQLTGFFLSADDVRAHLTQGEDRLREKSELLNALHAEEGAIQSEMDKVMSLFLAEALSKSGFAERYGPLETRRNQIRDEIPRVEGELDFLRIAVTETDVFIAEAQDLHRQFPELTPEEKRRVVESFCERIVVDAKDITIDLGFSPASAQTTAKEGRNLRDSSPRPGRSEPARRVSVRRARS